jgi:MATE family multidrug resistance protein
MHISDRLMLSQFSASSVNAIASAQILAATFMMLLLGVASIAEVFVGQYNGANEKEKVAKPVWQMIWFSIAGSVLITPFALWVKQFFLPKEFFLEAALYYDYSVYFLFLPPLNAALSAFFIGRGETFIVTAVAIVSNIVNLILNYVLIFGTNFTTPLGVKGAILATLISQILGNLILACIFLNNKNNRSYFTRKASIDLPLMLECVKIGGANSIGHTIEILAWTVSFTIVTSANPDYTTIHVIGQTIFMMFSFLTEGLKQGVSTYASNLIGSRHAFSTKHLIGKASYIHIYIMSMLGAALYIFSAKIIEYLFPDVIAQGLYEPAKIVLIFSWLYIVIDGFSWIIAGVLTAGGDTRFQMLVNILTSWFMVVIPLYIFLHIFRIESYFLSWYTLIFYGLINLIAFYLRYRYSNWLKLDLSDGKRKI